MPDYSPNRKNLGSDGPRPEGTPQDASCPPLLVGDKTILVGNSAGRHLASLLHNLGDRHPEMATFFREVADDVASSSSHGDEELAYYCGLAVGLKAAESFRSILEEAMGLLDAHTDAYWADQAVALRDRMAAVSNEMMPEESSGSASARAVALASDQPGRLWKQTCGSRKYPVPSLERAIEDLEWYSRLLCADKPWRYEVYLTRGHETRLSDSVTVVLAELRRARGEGTI